MKTENAINYFGSASKLAKALGISRHAIYQWGDDVPELRALQLEKMTSGKLATSNRHNNAAA